MRSGPSLCRNGFQLKFIKGSLGALPFLIHLVSAGCTAGALEGVGLYVATDPKDVWHDLKHLARYSTVPAEPIPESHPAFGKYSRILCGTKFQTFILDYNFPDGIEIFNKCKPNNCEIVSSSPGRSLHASVYVRGKKQSWSFNLFRYESSLIMELNTGSERKGIWYGSFLDNGRGDLKILWVNKTDEVRRLWHLTGTVSTDDAAFCGMKRTK